MGGLRLLGHEEEEEEEGGLRLLGHEEEEVGGLRLLWVTRRRRRRRRWVA